MSMPKPVLFYSQFCSHSSEAVRSVMSKNLRSRFVMICVDSQQLRHALPPQVDRVPMVFTPTGHRLCGDPMLEYIAKLGGGGDPIPLEVSNSMHTMYSWLDGDCSTHIDSTNSQLLHYDMCNGDEFPRIETPPDDSLRMVNQGQGQALQPPQFEAYEA
jgi:hypothetical protein